MGWLSRRKRIGLALGSGGARGWAHLGVWQALRDKNITVDYIAGTSMGAVVGACVAAGREEQLRELAENLDWRKLRNFFWEISLSRSGLTDGRRLLAETRKMIGVRNFNQLAIPFRAIATDLDAGTEVVLSTGNLARAIRASISIPGLFSPVKLGRHLLVDGGLVNPVPVNVARAMGATKVIAVDVTPGPEPPRQTNPPNLKTATRESHTPQLPEENDAEEEASAFHVVEKFMADIEQKARDLRDSVTAATSGPNMLEVFLRSLRIIETQIARARRMAEPPDILIEPEVGAIGTLDFQRAPEAIAAGYAATLRALGAPIKI